jgi:hypothetical protein
MPVQFPTLSIDQQTARYNSIAQQTYYPYSYSGLLNGTSTIYPHSDTSGGITIDYNTIAFLADNNMAISAIQILASGRLFFPANGAKPTTQFVMNISYSPVFTLVLNGQPAAAYPIPTIPGDTGNEILRINQVFNQAVTPDTNDQFSFFNIDKFIDFQPYNYILKYNQFLYINVGFDSNSLAANTAPYVYFTVIFHMLPTGLKV